MRVDRMVGNASVCSVGEGRGCEGRVGNGRE